MSSNTEYGEEAEESKWTCKGILSILFIIALVFVLPSYISQAYMSLIFAILILTSQIFVYLEYRKGNIKVFLKFLEIGICFASVISCVFLFTFLPMEPFFKPVNDPNDTDKSFIQVFSSILTNLIIASIMWLSILFCNPFTIQYSKESVPEDKWNHPIFFRSNLIISIVYACVFTFMIGYTLLNIYLITPWNGTFGQVSGVLVPLIAFRLVFKFIDWYRLRIRKQNTPTVNDDNVYTNLHDESKNSTS